jgi:hypothetical protein
MLLLLLTPCSVAVQARNKHAKHLEALFLSL